MKPVAIGGPQPRPWDRYRELKKPFCNIAGGVISPLLANVALHGLETSIQQAFPQRKPGTNVRWRPLVVRFADDCAPRRLKEGLM